MGVVAVPRFMESCENLSSLPSVSRGMPRPAESLRKTKESAEATSDLMMGFRFTAVSVGSPARGGVIGRGGVCPVPPLGADAMALFSPFHEPPGCHPQPAPEQ